MNHKSRFLVLALIVMLCLTTIAVAPAAVRAQGVTLRALIRPDEGANVATYVEKFKAETGIDVQVDFVGWAEIYNKTITTLAGGGGGYDIIFVPSANVVEFTSGGWFEPISDLIPAAEKDQWLASVVDMYTRDGELLAMPWYAGGAHMAYNKDVLSKAGVDPAKVVTWTDFIDACAKVKETNAAPFCFVPSAKYPGEFYYFWGSLVASTGAELFDADGKAIFQNSPEALTVTQLIKDAVDKGYFDKAGAALDDYETLIEFGNGKSAFLLDSTWSVTQAVKNPELSKIVGSADIMLIPGTADLRSGGYLYAGGLGLLKTSENKDAAKQFLTFLTSEEAQKHHAIQGANMPTRTSLYADKDIAASWTGFATLAEQLTYGKFPPQFAWFEEWRRSLASSMQDLINGAKTPEEVITFLVAETERLNAR
ncbi:MAG: sugar ABC transporter substrate-binding protein [Anaerolineae bacterium]|nr:sugar ABC transporter substrate-binding protein [Anaerolineae bacterium]